MFRYYTIIMIIQAFCLYHIFKNKKESYWYLVVIFLPFLGSLLYLFQEFGSRNNIEKVSETIKGSINKNYHYEQLLKEAKFTDTFTNRIKLGDHHASREEYDQAIALYESCLQGFNKDDVKTIEKLMVAKYYVDDFSAVIELGKKLEKDKTFKNSESRIVYAWALYQDDSLDQSEAVFKDMDVRFGNYLHRIEYARFLEAERREGEAKALLLSLKEEIDHMETNEKRQKKPIAKEINTFLKRI